MNINAINELSLKKNLRFGESKPQPAPAPETSSTSPESVLEAMHLQSMNNVSFQAAPSKAVGVMKKVGQRVAVALPLIAGGLTVGTTTSCDPNIWNPQPIIYPIDIPSQRDTVVINVEVNNEVNVNIDMSNMEAWLAKLFEQNALNAEQNAEFRAQLLELIQPKFR